MSDPDKKPDKNDPFDFFKLSPEPGNKNKKPKIPFWVILIVIVVATGLLNLFIMSRSTNDTIPFSDFRQMIESGQIVSVELGDTYFTGYGPSYSSYSSSGAVYKTAAILTEDFLKMLDEKGVTYRATGDKL